MSEPSPRFWEIFFELYEGLPRQASACIPSSGTSRRSPANRKLELEAQANELRHDEHRRRQAERVRGQLSDEVAQLRKWKGGKP